MDLEMLIELETEVWEALRLGDADADARLLADDFLGVYPTGFATRSEHVAQLANGPTMAEYELSEARMIEISPHRALLCYRADYRPVDNGRTAGAPAAMYISSLWSQQDGRWVNDFSQDTPVEIP